jgi:hypothetical protein
MKYYHTKNEPSEVVTSHKVIHAKLFLSLTTLTESIINIEKTLRAAECTSAKGGSDPLMTPIRRQLLSVSYARNLHYLLVSTYCYVQRNLNVLTANNCSKNYVC